MTGTALDPGDPRTIGPYRLLARLGSGGMGDVFLGRSPGGRRVAIKAVHRHLAADAEFVARFGQEVTAARAVGGFYTAAVIDADPAAARPWLATEYIPAPTLKQVVAQHGPLPESAVEVLASGIAEALGAIHAAGVVHRDLTPANVLVSESGPRVIDFGIARALAHTRSLTGTGAVIGSPGYMSPEHISGDEVTPVSDVFSLGAVLVFALTGAGPFGTGNLAQTMFRVLHDPPHLPELAEGALRQVITACLAKDPIARPGTEQVLAAFGRMPGETVDAAGWLPATLTTQRVSVRPRRRTVLLAGAGVAGTALLGVGIAALARNLTIGTTSGAALPEPGPPPGTVLWKTDVGAISDRELTAPAVDGNLVYAGSIDGTVYALDIRTGAVVWKAEMGSEIRRTPIVQGGSVFASVYSKIAAFDAATGQRRWPEDIPGALLGVGSDPEIVYATPRLDDGVVALDAATGKTLWTTLTDQNTFLADGISTGPGTAAIVISDTLFVLDPATGTVRWRSETECDRVEVAGSTLVAVGSSRGVSVLRLDTGAPVWDRRETYSDHAAVTAETIYVSADYERVYALAAADGELRWMARTEQGVLGPVAIGADTVYAVWGTGVHALDTRTGEQRWTGAAGAPQSAVRLVGRTLYGYADRSVYAMSA